ncbi:MAG: cbb3-type cytochrome c oxidase subunit I [Bacteroidetes bacterium]|nr:cbb3-type cytochrome c oxidase subunit I [Bacteroidota bacterium]
MHRVPQLFIVLALVSLVAGLLFGCLGGVQYLFPEWLKSVLPFSKIRPLHVTFVLAWIVLAASGIIYDYLFNHPVSSGTRRIGLIHFFVFLVTGFIIIVCFFLGIFGGREYFEFPPVLVLPILTGWILFAIIFFRIFKRDGNRVPVYIWMWGTGIIFMIFTLTEAHFWLMPYFRNNLVRDMTVQWKSYGALIGSWNMLVYGTAAYIMNKIHPNEKTIHGRLPFSLYLLGLVNLLFGWGHHTYIIPAHPWIRHAAYLISMTELLILGKMIWDWRKSFVLVINYRNNIPFYFLYAADIWIILNLCLAISISVPAINYFTHGTHFTVAHAMGTTVGINTSILLAAVIWLSFNGQKNDNIERKTGLLKTGFFTFNISLLIFWLALFAMGVERSRWMYGNQQGIFSELDLTLRPWYALFLVSGAGVMTGLLTVVMPALRMILWKKNEAA